MNCLVLGGAGFIGSHLCDALLAAGHHVRVFEKKEANLQNIKHLEDQIEITYGDFSDKNAILEALAGVEVVYHLIGTTLPQNSNANISYDISSNVTPTVQLLDGCIHAGVKKIIFSSSGGTVYGIPKDVPISEENPTNPICSYGIHKLTIEKYMQLYKHLYGLNFSILRISNPFGPRQPTHGNQGAVAVFIHKALYNEPIEIWGDGSIVRDYIHIQDVITAFLAVANNSSDYRIFNIGSGIGHSLLQIVSEIEKTSGKKINVKFSVARNMDVPINILSIENAKRVLGWIPKISFEEGISKLIHDISKNR